MMNLSKMSNSSMSLKVEMEMKAMLVIKYVNGQNSAEKIYQKAAEFVANQQLEVPDFEDYVQITEVTLDGKTLTLADATMRGLYNYLNQ
ncbi:hypothetical protein [Latilactobacillus sakei]|uniref:Uncharacterized protein n=1 Tax=Latilactobacillus sakei TaxID=1599 RepID=A0AAF0GP20_LATSK|nr:hypothetical protein [Latilactobacillus sakei]WGI19900.1 hypothetical protein QBD03_04105 [Latilactobacillus sakei]